MGRTLKQFVLLVSAVAGLAEICAAAKEKEAVVAPPPMAVAQEVSTRIGCPVTISLAVGGRIVEPLDFLIRRQPQAGTLGEIRRTGRNSATVTYTPGGKTGAGTDSFTFAAQSFDSPVSAAARVRIKITEAPPALDHPHEIDFGTIYLGQKSAQPLVLKNDGGGVASGSVETELPWSVAGTPDYKIAGGAKAVVTIEFAPSGEKEYSGGIRVGADPGAVVAVRGRGAAPITWSPAEIEIDPVVREAGGFSITLTNRTSETRVVAIVWPDFVKAPGEIALQAGGTETVKAVIAPEFLLAFSGSVELSIGGFSGRIPLRASPAPARLEIATGNKLDLGGVKVGRSAHGRFAVKNSGGTDTRLRVTTSRELDITPDPSTLILSPGKEQAFEVQLETTKGGEYSGNISIAADSGSASELVVKALFPKDVAPPKVNGPALPVTNFLRIAPATSSDDGPPLPAGSGAAVEAVSLLLSTPHEIEVTWKQKAPEVTGYRIERRRIMPGPNRTVIVEWVPWPEARVRIREGDVLVRFEHMPSDGMWTFRIVALDATGAPRSRSQPFRIFTQPVSTPAFLWWALGILGVGAVTVLVRAWRRRGRRLAQAENDRIARLGKS